ncbi:hypothetical protein B0G80_7150 [Paraburkholderia sp. BL6669N2]|uniref:hypothetical protein n=1 Tax=unclassified Paraburkholderia TaxID=2615204 RepID=UPI000D05FB17|nr:MULTISPECIES: hypothetical protein [unclassified Paraburkholderia]PRX97557.1 hypothetical protein B0G73_12718 [Paraburkholderia sp. BL25I1N1]REG50699.1 hypothetical protein B0G80_7150 [Paraburkholderia sp. BL6669N2]
MIQSPLPSDDGNAAYHDEAERVEQIVGSGPRGAIAVAGIATAIVIGMWYAFYFLVFLPRGVIQ